MQQQPLSLGHRHLSARLRKEHIMHTMLARLVFFSGALVPLCSIASNAQIAKLGPKEPSSNQAVAGDSELDHMAKLVTQLKLDIQKVSDPAAKKTASDNLELWQHLLDKLERENPGANNTAAEHHHNDDPAQDTLKQSPKPQ
jgi:hypothetical protein